MQTDHIAITGGTGFVGRKICQQLNDPLILTRSPEEQAAAWAAGSRADKSIPRFAFWNSDQILEPSVLAGTKGVIHLAGEPIAEGRWTTEKKQKIRDSRVIGTRCLVRSFAKMETRPDVLISASAVGFYGNRPGEVLEETSDSGSGFLPEVCEEWEAEAAEAEHLGIRVCQIRLGIVLDPKAGAMEKMLPFFRMGIAGPLGTGKQFFPWVHIDDVVGIILHCLNDSTVRGPVNAVAPDSINNRQFTKELGKALSRPTMIPVPKFGLKMLYGEFADSLFDDQHVLPKAAMNSGYRFQFPTINEALRDLLEA